MSTTINALFEDAGKFASGRVLSTTDASLQVELDSGKRVKVKRAQVLVEFAAPTPTVLWSEAQALAATIDLDLAWEFAPEDDFDFDDLAREYFQRSPTLEQRVAVLFKLHEAPHYFRRLGKGRFRKASAETVQSALAGIEKKRQQALQTQAWADELVAGRCPAEIAEQLHKILFKPDKNAGEYRAVVDAAKRSQTPALDLLRRAGAIGNEYQFHWQRFVFDHFPKGVKHGPLEAPPLKDDLPMASVQAFSIDDSSTTEIDDALSVQGLGTGVVTLGIHIAAPALAITPGSAIDKVAQSRMSTVYIPGWKMTMLPWSVVEGFTLSEGRAVPAVSLYVRIDESSLQVLESNTVIERVPVQNNLRHDQLDDVMTDASLADAEHGVASTLPYGRELGFLLRLAKALKAERERVRGRPEHFNRPEPVYTLEGRSSNDDAPPSGEERIVLGSRKRGAPLDLIVAEAMILANNTWGGLLASLHLPGIYRTQASLAPGVKVRMLTKPLPHAGIGVPHYAWCTSPLRRYVDLVNQWQIIAAVRHGQTAALAAPFKPRDASLLAIVSSFDAAYGAYADVQRQLERYWTLRWLEQEHVQEIQAVVVQDGGLARADGLPLMLRVTGAEAVPRGARVRVRIVSVDLLTLDVHATMIARVSDVNVDTETAVGSAPGEASALDDEGSEGLDEAVAAASSLVLAIDVDDATTSADEQSPPSPTSPSTTRDNPRAA